MTCHDARELFSALADDALAAPERADLDAHLAGCAECRWELERFKSTVSLLHAVKPARAPTGFVDRVLAAARPTPWYRRLARAVLLPWPVKLPLEAAAIVLVGVAVVYLFKATPELQQAARVDGPPAATETLPRTTEDYRRVTPPLATPAPKPKTAPAPASRLDQPEPPAEPRAQSKGAELEMAKSARAPAPVPSAPREERAAKLRDAAEGDHARSLDVTRSAPAVGAPAEQKADAPPADLVGRLTVADRGAAEHALAELVAKAGGREVARRQTPDGSLIELAIPRAAFPEFARGLAAIGRWQPAREVDPLPALVRVEVRLGG